MPSTRNPRVIATTRTHASSEDTYRDVRSVRMSVMQADGEIGDASALTIASWWQSPGTHGRAFAELSTTGTVAVEDLHSDIAAVYQSADARDREALDCLGTWALNHPSRNDV